MSKTPIVKTHVGQQQDETLNVCVLVGTVVTEPLLTTLSDGREVINYDVATQTEDGHTTVPVVMVDSRSKPSLGDEICAVGFVRKRFFRSHSSVQSRTEVVIKKSVKVRQRAQKQRLLERTADDLLSAG